VTFEPAHRFWHSNHIRPSLQSPAPAGPLLPIVLAGRTLGADRVEPGRWFRDELSLHFAEQGISIPCSAAKGI
jgi:hypothetical protein